jgi:hypothetical protein
MAINGKTELKPYSEVHIANQGFDAEFQVPVVQGLGYDGINLQRLNANALNFKITEVGAITYIAKAAPGTAQSEAKWQCMKIDESSGMVLTWADGDPSFDNVATDLTALTYS